MAKETGIPQSTISHLLAGTRSFTAAHAFAKYFGGEPGIFL